ncbi:helicase associated domain-containing protein [Streptomyces sp. NPDC056227]|uniref:helicase associated domain-containing protein n=1 Tax=Streptomyces sp. NPDC056227 TaxID=3345753 RepID=UPI0035DBF79E
MGPVSRSHRGAATQFAENLAAARAYHAEVGTLAAPRHATALDKPVGQWLTNLRRPDGLGKDPERAARRAEQLAAIDPDWNPRQLGWTVDWQRHYTGLTTLLASGAGLDDIQPGVTHHGDDIGRWLIRQRRDWGRHNEKQRRRLAFAGKGPAKASTSSGSGKGGAAFKKGLEALAQYVEREGAMPGRGHVEVLPDGTEHRTGIWIGNQKARRDKLDAEQLRTLAELGVQWAV